MRETWKKLSFIRARCAIELALDAGVRKLQRELAGQALHHSSSRQLISDTHAPADEFAIPRTHSGRTPQGANRTVTVLPVEARDVAGASSGSLAAHDPLLKGVPSSHRLSLGARFL